MGHNKGRCLRRPFFLAWLLSCLGALAHATPASVVNALQRSELPERSLSVYVASADGPPLYQAHAGRAANPASVIKLVTTYSALVQMGPAYVWKTPLRAHGQMSGDTLRGAVLMRGAGDPKLVVERLEPMLQTLRDAGIRRIEGDIVLDRRAFALPPVDPAEFDGEPLRPYNSSPDALLINFKSLVMTFTPDPAAGVARVKVEPPMAGVQMDSTVALSTGVCGDWRSALKATVADPLRLRFHGSYPSACGEREWPTAYADPTSHSARAVAGMWQRLGGELTGRVRDWQPTDAALASQPTVFSRSFDSLPLTDIVRDVNKFSNNVMAQHLLLTLGLHQEPALARTDTQQAGRKAVLDWWRRTLPAQPAPTLDNGSGLSRHERIRADALGQMLLHAQQSPVAREFMDSLPVSGQDKALARRPDLPAGQAWLKTGTLRDVAAIGGYVRGNSGKLYAVVAIINHPNASAGKPALDALVNWVAKH
jgi:D-alanyl-D-alanine carboxypeptidase/D-alanyl-D-alanine-endopeptidase (penicillin-binding protein 4)